MVDCFFVGCSCFSKWAMKKRGVVEDRGFTYIYHSNQLKCRTTCHTMDPMGWDMKQPLSGTMCGKKIHWSHLQFLSQLGG